MNRVAVHHSVLDPNDPVGCVLAARAGGLDAVGLYVSSAAEAEALWDRGAGSPLLAELVDTLLVTRVSVLDVGRIDLGAPWSHAVDDPRHRTLDLASRLGAQFVTVRAPEVSDDARSLIEVCAAATAFRVRPLLVPAPGTATSDVRGALAAVAGTSAGVVLDVRPGADDPDVVAELIVEAGDALGYVRVPADLLRPDMGAATSLLATLPPWVPVVVGAPADGPVSAGGSPARDGVFLTGARAGIDRLLIHPRALAAELGRDPVAAQ